MPLNKSTLLLESNHFSRIAPFAIFMTFLGLEAALRFVTSKLTIELPPAFFLWIYPVKTVAVGAAILFFRKQWTELQWSDLKKIFDTMTALIAGIVVFVLWVNMDWPWATFGTPQGFDPMPVSSNLARYTLIVFRILGASIVVPIMEELFWRSFLIRYIVSSDFTTVAIGRYTFQSFLISSLLFGSEHSLILAGVMAGMAYALLLYRTKSIAQCILAHGLTNLLLGAYVLQTGRWEFW